MQAREKLKLLNQLVGLDRIVKERGNRLPREPKVGIVFEATLSACGQEQKKLIPTAGFPSCKNTAGAVQIAFYETASSLMKNY